MGNFKLDMHVHTAEVSRCGRIKAEEVAKLHHKKGYDGIVITDHYYEKFFYKQGDLSWEEKIENYLEGYYKAKEVGQKLDLNVILGIEIRFIDSPNDYLVYGVTPEFLKEKARLYHLRIKEFSDLVANKEMLIYQAHPYRRGMERVNPDLLDGVEVFNAQPRHNSRNRLAYQFADENNLKMISGSDFHQREDLDRGGIVLPREVTNSQELVEVLKEEEVELITTDDFTAF